MAEKTGRSLFQNGQDAIFAYAQTPDISHYRRYNGPDEIRSGQSPAGSGPSITERMRSSAGRQLRGWFLAGDPSWPGGSPFRRSLRVNASAILNQAFFADHGAINLTKFTTEFPRVNTITQRHIFQSVLLLSQVVLMPMRARRGGQAGGGGGGAG